MKIENLCRTCLGSDTELSSLSTNVIISDNKVSLVDILLQFYSYKVDPEDTLPKNICSNCVYQLTMTYSFKKLVEHSAETLSNTIHSQDHANNNSEDSDLETVKEEIVEIVPNKFVTKHLYCAKCKENFDSVKALRTHSQKHPIENSSGRNCEYCPEQFTSLPNLIVHRKHHFAKYVCEKCWACSHEYDEFYSHVCEKVLKNEQKIGLANRALCQCDQCGKSYPHYYIKYHMLIHSEKRSHCCRFCPKKFKVRSSLNSHIQWKHERIRNHKCPVCSATFISASSKSAHIRKHHLNERKYICDSCSKRFFSKSGLDRHMLTHTGMKNYHCHICTKSYQTRYGLNVHLKVHNNGHVPDLCHWKNG